ncbi:MAG TPA: SUMF1/EgtB/PvdO family nonheme iron enzyme [Longimicrobiales bacterium]|nr:SUMF1/EgtB/PvdO family nonheme iron enzyme [Longimicrobiales bacterium]
MSILRIGVITVAGALLAAVPAAGVQTGGEERTWTNSVGMEMVRIEPGTYLRGSDESDERRFHDERPVHEVTISRAFYMSATPVTNAQYEEFDPSHRAYRGMHGLSEGDDDAVLFVSWHDAVAYTQWLSEREGRPYRLPTEAEGEYAARAGTTTAYSTGDSLPEIYHRHQRDEIRPVAVSLAVAQSPPNAWGLYDMHGLVEEWCLDWYGPYVPGPQTDPVGYADGLYRVTRGGSHNTGVSYLRSAARFATIPEDRHWLIGFRVVQAEMPESEPLPPPGPELWARDVSREVYDWSGGPDPEVPFFRAPEPFIHFADDSRFVTFQTHNPTITHLPNGDLFAIWHAMVTERGRELSIVGARLRAGAESWDPATEFFRVPGRNTHGPALFHDGEGTLYHFNGLSTSAEIHHILALVMRTSTDNGATWSRPRLIEAEHNSRHQVIDGAIRLRDGTIVVPADANPGGTALHMSEDGGETWRDAGGTITGIHAGVVELADGTLMAIGRGGNIDDRAPISRSTDRGATWTVEASPFPPIRGGQRPVLLRLREGPIMYIGFTDDRDTPRAVGWTFTDAAGQEYRGYGLFAALSYDEGRSWPVRKLITAADGVEYFSRYLGRPTTPFTATRDNAEYGGYMAATQTPDGVIHLLSSRLHYRFNLAWLETPAPAE